jgi:acyl-coenzyme A thioesterase PaaI-like protein
VTPATSTTLVDLPDTWAYGRGILHGGWLLETVSAAVMEQTTHSHPLAVSAHFLSPAQPGTATLEVEPLRAGRTVGTLRARLTQGDRLRVEVLVTAGTLPAVGSPPLLVDAAAPSLPSPEQCPVQKALPGTPRNGIIEQLEVRLDPSSASWLRGRPGGSPEVRGWIRSAVSRPVDPLLLLTVADALPPVTLDLGIDGWVPTIELTVLLRCLPAQGWLRVLQRAKLVHGGWLDEECEVWDSSGQLVAQARQLAGYREPDQLAD